MTVVVEPDDSDNGDEAQIIMKLHALNKLWPWRLPPPRKAILIRGTPPASSIAGWDTIPLQPEALDRYFGIKDGSAKAENDDSTEN